MTRTCLKTLTIIYMEHQKNDHNGFSIFVDADAFIDSLKADDPNHERAKDLFARLKPYPIQFMTHIPQLISTDFRIFDSIERKLR
jgi:hypothetical protein